MKKIINFTVWVVTIFVFMPIYYLFYLLFLITKIIRCLCHVFMLNFYSANDELKGFWKIKTNLKDYFLK